MVMNIYIYIYEKCTRVRIGGSVPMKIFVYSTAGHTQRGTLCHPESSVSWALAVVVDLVDRLENCHVGAGHFARIDRQ